MQGWIKESFIYFFNGRDCFLTQRREMGIHQFIFDMAQEQNYGIFPEYFDFSVGSFFVTGGLG